MALDNQMSAELASELSENNRELVTDPRTVPVRFSNLRHIARSALHYWYAVQEGKRDEDTEAKRLGRAAHAIALGGRRIAIFKGAVFNGKEYKGAKQGAWWDHFKKENAGNEIVTPGEYEKAKAIADALRRNPRAAEMLYEGGTELELEVEWTWLRGRKCLSHFDAYRKGVFVADMKGARDGALERFGRQAIWSAYHAQCAFYVTGAEELGHPTPDAFLLVVETGAPHVVTVRRLTPRAVEAGRRQCRAWFELLLGYEASNEWPGYSDAIVDLDVVEVDEPYMPDTSATAADLEL